MRSRSRHIEFEFAKNFPDFTDMSSMMFLTAGAPCSDVGISNKKNKSLITSSQTSLYKMNRVRSAKMKEFTSNGKASFGDLRRTQSINTNSNGQQSTAALTRLLESRRSLLLQSNQKGKGRGLENGDLNFGGTIMSQNSNSKTNIAQLNSLSNNAHKMPFSSN